MNENFVAVFKNSNMSVYRLSKRAGVAYTNVYELVHGKKNINHRPVATVKRIAIALGCQIEDLLNPLHFMDGVSGKYYGVSYTWFYDGQMVLRIRDGKKITDIPTGLQMDNMENRKIYDGVADAYIQVYIKERDIQKQTDRILSRYHKKQRERSSGDKGV